MLAVVAGTPGFPRALARTFGDVRLAALGAADVQRGADTAANTDLSHLIDEAEQELRDAGVADRARLFEAAREGVPAERALTHPLILLDLDLGSPVEEAFVAGARGRRERGAGHRAGKG